MGIYDRDYYRREGPGFLASLTERGQVCKWLILINVGVFVIQLLTLPVRGESPTGNGPGWFTEALWLDPQLVLQGQVWRLLTYAFLHDIGWMHIFFNMLFLWFFGREVEDLYGPREFLAFYLTAAVLGGIAFMPWALRHVNPLTEHSAVCLGASGAVMACMVLFATHFPHRVIYFWGLFPIPIWLLVLFYVGHDAYVFFVDMQTPTAVTVHLAGAAFGFFYQRNQWRLTRFWPRFSEWRRERSRARLRVYRDEEQITPVRETPTPSAPEMDEQLEAKVDAVLEKVSRYGQESLTDSERELLFRASELYKRRRS